MHRYRGAYRLEFVTYRDLLEAAVGQVAFRHSPQPPRVRDMTEQCRKAGNERQECPSASRAD